MNSEIRAFIIGLSFGLILGAGMAAEFTQTAMRDALHVRRVWRIVYEDGEKISEKWQWVETMGDRK